jgi:uncharacterized membrane protein YgaE (UPF0421/DUF939 family)
MSTSQPLSLITGNQWSLMGNNPARRKWPPILVHSARTAVAAMASLIVPRLFRLPEPYWAPVTSLVITQSSLGTVFSISGERFIGTLLGAAVGAIVAGCFPGNMLVFGTSVFILGLLTAATNANRSAYRFAGVTLSIVLLVPRIGPAWHIALDRFAEVSIGLGVALMLSMLWPEQDETR